MTALVPELVNMASDPAISTTDLLRRALVAARRLNSSELATWIGSELNGYEGDVPDYRKLRGTLEAYNPVRGYVPLLIIATNKTAAISIAHLRQPLPELEKLAEGTKGLYAALDPEVERQLLDLMEYPMRPAISLSATQFHGAIEVVRTRVLEWALDLENRGIHGQGMSFTQQEKQTVQQLHYHFGNVSGSQIQINSNESNQKYTDTSAHNELEALKGLIDALGEVLDRRGAVQDSAVDELHAELATLKAQVTSPKPKWDIIKATARTIKTVAEGATGDILAEIAKPHVATLLALAASAV